MKKYLLSALLIGSLGAAAQITVTATDVATIGSQVLQANDTFPSVVPGPGGASQTWNFSNLNNHVQDTLIFTNPNWLPNGSSFPTSNLAVRFGTNGDAYCLLNSTSLMVQGQVGDFGFGPMVINMNPDEQIMKFPATMGTNFTNSSAFSVAFPFPNPPMDSARIKSSTTKADTVDGWGTVTTPLASNINTIRMRELNVTIDSFFIHITVPFPSWQYYSRTIDTEYVYIWWANNTSNLYGFPLVEIRTDSSFTVTGATWLPSSPTQSGIAEYNNGNVSVYPNPATDVILFRSAGLEVEYIVITDVSGRELKKVKVVSDETKVSVSDLAPGSYYYLAKSRNESIRRAGKFSIGK